MEIQPKRWSQRLLTAGIGTLSVAVLTLSVPAEDKQPAPTIPAEKPALPQDSPGPLPAATQQTAPRTQIFFPELTKFEKKFQEQLRQNTTSEFEEAALADVIQFYAAYTGVDFVLNKTALGDAGLTPEEPITMSLKNVSLQTALELTLEPIGFTYVVDRDVVRITSTDIAEEMLKTRVYPVGDLCQTPLDYLQLESVLKSANLGTWRKLKADNLQPQVHQSQGYPGGVGGLGGGMVGGSLQADQQAGLNALLGASRYADDSYGGTISIMPQSNALVICQTYHTHNAIVELLTQLRQAKDLRHK